jgi:hypothetical protein
LAIAHNLRYDLNQFLDTTTAVLDTAIIKTQSSCSVAELILDGGAGRRVHMLDSMVIINMALSKFGTTFGLDIGKEVMPYKAYTLKRLNENPIMTYEEVRPFFERGGDSDWSEFVHLSKHEAKSDIWYSETPGEEALVIKDTFYPPTTMPTPHISDSDIEEMLECFSDSDPGVIFLSSQTPLVITAEPETIDMDMEESLITPRGGTLNESMSFNMYKYAQFYCERDCEVLLRGFCINRATMYAIEYDDNHNQCQLDVVFACSVSSYAKHFTGVAGCWDGVYELCGSVREYVQRAVIGGRYIRESSTLV